MTTFDDFIAEIEAEARAQGPKAVAELEAFRLHFPLARQLAAQRLTQKQLAARSGRREHAAARSPPPAHARESDVTMCE